MRQRQIAIFVDMLSSFGRGIMDGVSRYTRSHAPWTFWGDPERIVAPIEDLATWRGDGVIAQVWEEWMLDLLLQTNLPFVNVSDRRRGTIPGSVIADNIKVGELATQHFLERGFRSFAYCGFEDHRYSELRLQGFSAAVAAEGCPCATFVGPAPQIDLQQWTAFQSELAEWVRSLPRPTGMLCCNDVRARHVAQVCLNIGVRIPEDLAIVGADNDALLCEMNDPPLSSIDVSPSQIGYEAAQLLDHIMDDVVAPRPPVPVLIPPAGVITRRSSDILAIGDAVVADAVRFIHDQVGRRIIGVDDVVAAVPVSRRVLERRFRASLGRTVGEEIDNARIAQAKRLIVHGEARISDIALRSGFAHVQQLNRLFKQITGITPVQYRRQFRSR